MCTQVNNEKEDSTDQVSPLPLHLNQGEPIRYIIKCALINVNPHIQLKFQNTVLNSRSNIL